MRDYARDKRENDIYSRMRIIAKALTRDEIEELAVYYARLGNKLAGHSTQQASTE
jgi:cytochrome c553